MLTIYQTIQIQKAVKTMKKFTTCGECGGTGEIVTRELPFEVGDRVVAPHQGGTIGGVVVCPRITSDRSRIRTPNGTFPSPVYVVKFDGGHTTYVGEDALGFEEE